MENLVRVEIDNKIIEVPSTYTIMEAAYKAGIKIPRLCFLKDISETSACRICVVEIEGVRTLKNSCTVKVTDGMKVKTNTDRVRNSVVNTLQLLAANHKFECWKCPREHNCEFLQLLRRYNVENVIGESKFHNKKEFICNITDSIEIDSSKCLLCGRCIATCEHETGLGVINYNYRGFKTYVSSALNHPMDDSGCIYCGKCIQACPVGAIKEKDNIQDVIKLINGDDYVVCQIAPAVRAAIGEEFGYKIGQNVEGKLYHALKLLGFDDITDVNFGADLTIMEEGTEFIHRFQENKNLPMFTSCSPGWINYIEKNYPEYLPNLSSCKSPQQMNGAIIKHYYSKVLNVPAEKIKVVSIMPCIAKKHEANRPEMESDGIRDVDVVLTTRELAKFIKIENIAFTELEDYKPTSPLAKYTGAGVIFGATGGVMEAALRTVYYKLANKELDINAFAPIRGAQDGIKEMSIDINGTKVNICVVHGAKYIPELMKLISSGEKQYHFVEIMACSGGCVNGGGQPIVNATMREQVDVRSERAKVLYNIDEKCELRLSHTNPEIIKLYNDFLKEPGGKLSHKLLHTKYTKQEKYSK